MNDTTIRAGAVIDRCVLDKEIEIGPRAQLGIGVDLTPNQLEPANLDTASPSSESAPGARRRRHRSQLPP